MQTGHGGRHAAVGERAERNERSATLGGASIRAFAAASGDFNPPHHDEQAAHRTLFGTLIASGPQTAALLMGLSATHFCARAAALGLDFRLQLRRAVTAGDTLLPRRTVTRVEARPSAGGALVSMQGELFSEANELGLSADGLVACHRQAVTVDVAH